MSARASYFKLGLFVVSAVAILVAGIIVLGAGKLFERKIIVETYTDQSVEGLTAGSAVKYRGITLGDVAAISLTARKYDPGSMQEGRFGSTVLIELAISRKRLPRLSDEQINVWLDRAVDAGLRARLASSGLTGPTYIELVYVDPSQFPMPRLAWTPPPLYIPSVPSTTAVLLTAAEKILKKIEALELEPVISDVDTLIKTANAKVADVDTRTLNEKAVALLDELRTSNARIQEILKNPSVDASLEDLHATLENAKQATARIDEILHDPRVDKIIGNVETFSGDAEPGVQDIRRLVLRLDRLVATQQTTIEAALLELRRALTNINAISDDATQNPSRLLFGEPPPKDGGRSRK
jgi:ABC-type transporter Mla subunit MlaD